MKKTTIHINSHKKERSISSEEKVAQKKEVSTSSNKLPIILIVFTLAIALFIWSAVQNRNQVKINNYETCKKAGYPIMESYPAQCKGPNGTIYTEVVRAIPSVNITPTLALDAGNTQYKSIDPSPKQSITSPSYKGSSLGNCNQDRDCFASGCNKEICQSKDAEPLMSTCEYREDTPLHLGYTCGCVQKQCAWKK